MGEVRRMYGKSTVLNGNFFFGAYCMFHDGKMLKSYHEIMKLVKYSCQQATAGAKKSFHTIL